MITYIDGYKYYSSQVENPISRTDYQKIIKLYHTTIGDLLLEGHKVHLPSRMGNVQVIGRKENPKIKDGKITGLAPNWRKTKELWDEDPEAKKRKQLVYCTNEHSNGIRYKYLWSKKDVLVANKTLFTFIPVRRLKRQLSKLIMEGREYYTIDSKWNM